jgi:hypothetical protein
MNKTLTLTVLSALLLALTLTAIDANDSIYDVVTAAVRQAVDSLEPHIQTEVERAIQQALDLSDDILLEFLVYGQRARIPAANDWLRRFATYRQEIWQDRRDQQAAELTDGWHPLTQETP